VDESIHNHQRPSFRDFSISLVNLAHCSLDKLVVGERRWTARASSKELSKSVSSTFRKALAADQILSDPEAVASPEVLKSYSHEFIDLNKAE
jgi:hypothetical protein